MDASGWIALFSGLVGALIGAGSSLISQWLQLRNDRKKHLLAEAVRAAIEEYRIVASVAQTQSRFTIYPLPTFIVSMVETVKLIDSGKISPDSIKELIEKQHEFNKVYAEMDAEHRANKRKTQ